jgi:FkbM family methyltransferase
VLGFEPDSVNYQKALKNIGLNSFDNLEVVNKGLGPAEATARLFRVNEGNAGMNRILPETGEGERGPIGSDVIEIVALDDFAAERGLPPIDLIKIDVEGYEMNVLRGAQGILRQHRPILFIELDDDNLRVQNDSAAQLVSFLEGHGYRIYRADNKKKVTSADDFTACHFDIICEGRD